MSAVIFSLLTSPSRLYPSSVCFDPLCLGFEQVVRQIPSYCIFRRLDPWHDFEKHDLITYKKFEFSFHLQTSLCLQVRNSLLRSNLVLLQIVDLDLEVDDLEF
jgi:hypothetical protein